MVGSPRNERRCVVVPAHAATTALDLAGDFGPVFSGHYAPPGVHERMHECGRERTGVIGVADAGVELLWGMRLTRKFIAALVIGVAIVALVQGSLDYQRERDVVDRQMQGEADALGRTLGLGLADVWHRDGEAAAREFLIDANNANKSGRLRVRWVWLDAKGHDAPLEPRDQLEPMKLDSVVVIRDRARRPL